MSLKSFIAKKGANYYANKIKRWSKDPFSYQEKIFREHLSVGKNTLFGKAHNFDTIKNYEDFKRAVPLRDYDGFHPYIEKIIAGEQDVLWKGMPKFMVKSSGTTLGTKFIPVSQEGMPTFINAGRQTLAMYIAETGNVTWVDGSMIFIQASPVLEQMGAVKVGRMSGIVYSHIPGYLRKNLTPTYETNTIEDWEEKLTKICEETLEKDMTVIGGIPPWALMYFERLLEMTGKSTVKEIFPNFELYVYGGLNFAPYREQFRKIIGSDDVAFLEMYNASEGFIAFQDKLDVEGMLLNLDGGIFYEFVPANEIHNENPTRLRLEDVKLDVNYAIILNNNSGFWGYIIGDTVRFVSKNPYRIAFTGRIKHFISAFGEHVIGEEVDEAIRLVAEEENIGIIEFTVAPQVTPKDGQLPCHEWFIEFVEMPKDLKNFVLKMDNILRKKNIFYDNLINSAALRPLIITPVPKDGFRKYMKSKGKLGGQNKMPRLANSREYADGIIKVLELDIV